MPDSDDPDGPGVPDADPSAEVYVRADRTLYGVDSRNRRTYHLFPDCHHILAGKPMAELSVGDIWQEDLPVCTECEKREKVRATLADDVPANPDPDDKWLPDDNGVGDSEQRRQNARRADRDSRADHGGPF